MSPDNFLVRPHRKLVEDYSQAQAWQTLTSVDAPGMVDALGDLPTSATEQDEEAKRFDLLVLRLQLAVLRQEDTFPVLADQMKTLAGALSEMGNIPMVSAVMPLILDLASDLWWEGATLPMLEQVRLKLRGLVKLIERVQKKILYTDFEDELGVPQEVDLGGFTAGTDPEKFKAKVRQFLLEHESHFAILRLRTNQPLTTGDLVELERMLAEAGLGAPDQLAKAKEECHGLGLFIRSLVGLDREAAKAAFNGFVNGRTLNASQLEFIDMMIDHLTQHGVMDPGLLYESPFTDLNSIGIDARLRTVDRAQYKQRLDQFDFDMILITLNQTLSPGLEQWQYFHSSQAAIKGSKNYAGIANPVVDHLLEQLLAAQTREEQLAAGRALDRVLLWQHYSIPNWYLNYHRLAYRNRFAFVTTPPYSLGLSAWWLKASEKAQ